MPRGGASTAQTNKTDKAAREYDAVWENDMRCNGVYMPDIVYDQPQPRDKAWLQAHIRRHRDSVSSTRPGAVEEWLKVKYDLRLAANEASVRQVIEPKLLCSGRCSVCPHIHKAADVYMSNYAQLVPKVPRLSQPDSVDGAPPGTVGLPILAVLGSVIQPSSTQPQALLLPNFFLEFKGPGGEERVALRQVLLGCAYGARGVEALESLALLPVTREDTTGGPFGRALAFGATFVEGTLSIYCMHVQLCAPGEAYDAATDDTPRPLRVYHMVKLDSFDMTVSAENYYAGIAAICNVRELARDIRVAAISSAKARVANLLAPLPPYQPSQQGDDAPPAAASGNPATSASTSAAARKSAKKAARGAVKKTACGAAKKAAPSRASSGKRNRADVDDSRYDLRSSSRKRQK
jgi:hypothetical protein